MDEKRAECLLKYLVLHRLPNIGSGKINRLLELFGSIEGIFQESPTRLSPLLSKEALQELSDFHKKNRASQAAHRALLDLDWLVKHQLTLMTIEDVEYPPQLKEIHYPPALLFIDGNPAYLNTPQLAIVGSRKASPSGLKTAEVFSRCLSNQGLTITSGMALGIDGAAHHGALLNQKPTIAVVATGLDIVYPSRHRALAEQIREYGAIISEFPLGTKPQAGHFPRRNRIISGLSQGVLVVEAEIKSGSLITAHCAVEENRDVFAIPGSIQNPGSCGCNQLIKQGAVLVTSPEDVLTELNSSLDWLATPSLSSAKNVDLAQESLKQDEQSLLDYLDWDAVTLDEIIRRSQLPVEKITPILISLELKGWINLLPSGYCRC